MSNMSLGEAQKPLSIFEITKLIDQRITAQPGLTNIYIKGEITEFKIQSASGHAYFTLTDKESGPANSKKAILKCTFFRYTAQNQTGNPKPGMEVLVYGSISLYYQGGQYNFNAREIIEIGLGKLMIQIQELKQKFIREGIIDPAKRRKLPEIPKRIGIVTGLGTAALKDILKQVKDRYPHVEVLVSPALVQGQDAPRSIVAALEEIARPEWKCDVILVGRGGGSAEDLMAFNDENVCRAIHACPVPVISAVGHQIDHPVSDDVADVAAATPTDGAKIALPVIREKFENLSMISRHINNLMTNRFDFYGQKLRRIQEKPFFRNPQTLIMDYYRLLDEKEMRLQNAVVRKLEISKNRLSSIADIQGIMEKKILKYQSGFSQLYERLSAFSPLATLKRGYSLIYKNDAMIKTVGDLKVQDKIRIRLNDGNVTASVEEIQSF